MKEIVIDEISFGGLPKDILIEIFKDGRASSKLMEHYFANKFGMQVVKGDKDHDLESKRGLKYEVKAFTKYGCNFGPSMHTGDKGYARQLLNREGKEAYMKHKLKKQQELEERAAKMSYIIYDITNFPKIKYVVIQGKKLIKMFPKGKIPVKKQEEFFG